MTTQLDDNADAQVTIGLDEAGPIGAYTVHLADGTLAGSAYFVDSPEPDRERIFFHTAVGLEFSGRGLAGRLIREALADSIRKDLTVVPVCPLFAGHLDKHGDQFIADGGRFRRPTGADIALVRRLSTNDA